MNGNHFKVEPEVAAQFTDAGRRHAKCGGYVGETMGMIKVPFCPSCTDLDLQAIQALDVALKVTQQRGEKVGNAPYFGELTQQEYSSMPALRAWEFYNDSDEPLYVYLNHKGEYQTKQ